MADCKSFYNQYVTIFHELLAMDNQFSNWDYLMEYLLKADLPQDQLAMSIQVFGAIYDRLNISKPSIVTMGNWKQLNESIAKIYSTPNQTQELISLNVSNAAKSLYNKETKKDYNKRLEELTNILNNEDIILITNVQEIGNIFIEQLKRYANEPDKLQKVKDNIDSISKLILSKDKTKGVLFNQMINITTDGNKNYKALDTVEGVGTYQNKPIAWILTNDYRQKYVIIDSNRFYEVIYNNNGITIGDEINGKNIKIIKSPRRTNEVKFHKQEGKTFVANDTISDGMVLRPLDESKEGLERFNKMISTATGIEKIMAVKVSEEPIERTNYIKDTIKGRQHETFETPGQQAYLEHNPEGVVVTVSRPNKGVVFIAENKETIASLYGLSNFVFVTADNKTIKVDFHNPEHLKLLQTRAVKADNSKLSYSEILEMQRLSDLYDEFSKEVENKIGDNNAIDVTDIFNKYYTKELQNNVKELWTIEKRIEAVFESKYSNPDVREYDVPLNIVQVDKNGKIIMELGIQNIPFVMFYDKLQGEFVVVSPLDDDQFIYENGEFSKPDEYFKSKRFENKTWYEHITKGQEVNPSIQNMFIITWGRPTKETGFIPRTYQIVEMLPVSRQASNIAFTVGSLFELVNSTDTIKEAKATSINKEGFEFNVVKTLGKITPILNVKFGISSLTKKATIYLKSYAGSKYENLFQKIKDNKVQDIISFELDEVRIKKLFENVINSKVVSNFQESAPFVHQGKIETKEQLDSIVKAAEKLNSKEATLLLESMNKVHNELVSIFDNALVKALLSERTFTGDKADIKNELYKELLDSLKEDFKLKNGSFAPQFILFKQIPNTNTEYNLNLNYKEDSRNAKSIRDVRILQRPYDKASRKPLSTLRIVPNAKTEVTPAAQPAINNTPLHTEITKAEEKIKENKKEESKDITKQSDDLEIDDINDEDIPYELASRSSHPADKIQQELEQDWLKENLNADVKEFEGLTINNNIVLGYVKDQTIFLNSQMRSNGTLYHEAFHYTFRYLFDKPTRDKLIAEIHSDSKYDSHFTKVAVSKFRTDRNYNPTISDEDVRRTIAEEILANKFKGFALEKQKRTEKTGIVRAFLKLLDKIVKLFTRKSNEIDLLFNRIYTGEFKNTQRKQFSDNLTEAYALIPTIRQIVINPATGKPRTEPYYLSDNEQSQLINMIVAYMSKDKSTKSFDDKFDRASKQLLEEVWSLDTIYALNNATGENDRKKIKDAIGNTITAYRFLLGDRLNENPNTYDINFTGDDTYSNRMTKNYSIKVDNRLAPNDKGEYSRELLKTMVQKEYEKIVTLEGFIQLIDDIENDVQSVDIENVADTGDDKRFDAGISEFNVVKQNVGLIRKFLSSIVYTRTNPITGIKTLATADPVETFNTIVQATTNLSDDNIIPSLKNYSEIIREDGYTNEADVIEAVYKALVTKEHKEKDSQFVNLFKNVFQTIELPYMFFSVDKTKERGFSYTLKDKLLDTDLVAKKKSLYQEFAATFEKERKSAEYKEHVKNLKSLINKYFESKNLSVKTMIATESIDKVAQSFADVFTGIGFKMAKSSMKLALLQHLSKEYTMEYNLYVPDADKNYLESFSDFIKEQQYFDKTSISSFYNTFLQSNTLLTASSIVNIVEPIDRKVPESLKAFDAQLKKALLFIFKHDPKMKPSVSKNAEGKPIYRYVRPNPLSLISNKFRREGLKATLETDELWSRFLKEFATDDPIYGAYLNSAENKELDLFFKNFSNALFGGVQQSEYYTKFKEGKNFSDLDKQSLLLLNIAAFTKIRTHTEGGTSIKIFLKQYHQLESIGTNYFVTSMYHKEHATSNSRINSIIKGKIQQEYNRIKREYAKAQTNLELFTSKTENNLILNYNALDEYSLENGEIVRTLNTESNKLRAYNFVVMNDVFDENPELRTKLIDAAKKGEDFISTPELEKLIDEYSTNQFKIFLQDYIDTGIIDRTGKSTLLPKVINVDYNNIKIEEYYAGSKTPIIALLRDMFFNSFESNLTLNALIDGDVGLNIKNKTDLTKRYKKLGATGSTLRDGTHTVLFLNTITQYISEKYPTYGPYRSTTQILNDPSITDEAIKEELIKDFESQVKDGRLGDSFQKTFDGQSVSNVMHVIDMLNKFGRVNDVIKNIMIDKSFRELTEQEIALLSQYQVSFNSKKTVTSSRHFYLKLSEMTLDRNDVSLLWNHHTNNFASKDEREVLYAELKPLYHKIYNLRFDIKNENNQEIKQQLLLELQTTAKTAHSYFKAYPGRELRHNLLNTMEYYNIDQVVDTEASKNTTIYGLDVQLESLNQDGYYDGYLHTQELNNESKYLQVETSGQHDDVSYAVQLKMLSIADLLNIDEILKNENLTKDELNGLKELNTLMHQYQNALKESAQSRLDYFQNVMRNEDDIDMGELYQIIGSSLEKQGAGENIIKFFRVDPVTNKPVFNSNMPIIRSMLIYYVFSMYSKNITDEKTTGKKYIHESAWGNKVIHDTFTGQVVTTDTIKNNPSLYFKEDGILLDRYITRELATYVEEIDGVKHITVEVMISMPPGLNEKEKRFYMNHLTKGVGTRIPTEDKRSMVSFKVVDFVDGSKQNAFIMPYFAHMLAGSDFDVDSLYAQHLAYFKDVFGDYKVYGEYTEENKNKEKFLEYINYLSEKSEFRDAITEHYDEHLSDIVDENYLIEETKKVLASNKITEIMIENLTGNKQSLGEVSSEIQKLKIAISELPENSTDKRDLDNKLRLLQGKQRSITRVLKINSIISVLHDKGMLKNPNYNIVSYVHQNNSLKALGNILSNITVFNKLYINQRSSTQAMKDALLKFGKQMKLENFVPDGNMYSPAYVVAAKIINSSGKKGIEQTASINKFFALANQFNLKLKPEQVIWAFTTAKDDKSAIKKVYDTYGTMVDSYVDDELIENNKRVIEFIGNILGMFADAAKDPIPNALGFNEINTSVALSMIGLGLPLEFVLGFNFIGSIRNAVANMQAASYGITEDINTKTVYFSNMLEEQIAKLKAKDPNIIIYDIENLDSDKLQIDWKAPEGDGISPQDILKNTLLPSDVGYTVSYDGEILTPETQEFILLSMYKAQVQQIGKILPINGATSGLMKSLNPDTLTLDKITTTIEDLKAKKKDSIFTDDSIDRLFADDKVFNVLTEIVDDLSNQLDKMFIERSPMFKSLVRSFSRFYDTGQEVANRFVGFLALRSYLNTYMVKEANDPNVNDYYKQYISKDQDNLKKAFSIYGMYDTAFIEELNQMKAKYPDNEFLSLLHVDKTGNPIYIDGKIVNQQNIRIFATTKLKNSEYLSKVNNDIQALFKNANLDVRLFMNHLFFKELVRTGMQPNVTGQYLNYFPEMLSKVSQPIDTLMELLINPDAKADTIINTMKELYNISSEEELEVLFTDLVAQMINGINPENVNFKDRSNINLAKIRTAFPNYTIDQIVDMARTIFGNSIQIVDNAASIPLSNYNKDNIELNFDFSTDYMKENSGVISLLASRMNVFYDNVEKTFIFPPIMKINKQVFVISKIDGTTTAIGKNLVESFIQGKEFDLKGSKAEYVVFDIPVNKNVISNPVHFTLQDMVDLNNAKSKKLATPIATINQIIPQQKQQALPRQESDLSEKNIFTVEPIQSVDKKAKAKAKIATQYIGFAEGIAGSSTAEYAKQISEQNNKPNTLKEYADKTSTRFVNTKEVLRKDDIEYYNDRVNDLIQGRLQYAIFAKEDLKNRQYLPFINKLKDNGFINVDGMEWVFSRGGKNPKTEYENLSNNNIVNSGNYSSNDVIFVSIGGKRGDEVVRKQQQDRTIREAIKALEAGATLITDNVNYIHYNSITKQQRPISLSVQEFEKEHGLYNLGEKRLYENLKSKGYNYFEITVDGHVLGVWNKGINQIASQQKPTSTQNKLAEQSSITNEKELINMLDAADFINSLPVLQYTKAYGAMLNVPKGKYPKLERLLEESINLNEIFSEDKPAYYILDINKLDAESPFHSKTIRRKTLLVDTKNKKLLEFNSYNDWEGDGKKTIRIYEDSFYKNPYLLSNYHLESFEASVQFGKNKIYNINKNFYNKSQLSKTTSENKQSILTFKVDQFNYSINPETGLVTHLAKTGDRTETNTTQIGKVYALYAKATNSLVVTFNGQQYAKVFNMIVNINNGNIVIQPQIAKLFDKPIKKEESKVIVLNEDQLKAKQEIMSFLSDPKRRTHALIGYAGTGKTLLINMIEKEINRKNPFVNVVFSSPTHRANAVIKLKNPHAKVYTLHSLLGLSLEEDLETFDVSNAKFNPQNNIKLSYGDILIIDESSMINDDLYDFINKRIRGAKILYVGDDAQIKPVKQVEKSKAFTEVEQISRLTKVERADNNSLLNESMIVRNTGNFSYRNNKENDKGVEFIQSRSDFMKQAFDLFNSEEFKNNPLLIRILSGTNVEVNTTNEMLRNGLFGQNASQYEKGDIIMGYNNWNIDFKTKQPLINNGGDYKVVESTPESRVINNIKVNGYKIELENLLNKEQDSFVVFVLDKNTPLETLNALGEKYESLRLKALSHQKGTPQYAQAWIALDHFKHSFVSPVDIKYKGYTKIGKTIDYGYAHTIHKSQGGTYKYSYILADTIDKFKDEELKSQLKYVAVTRAESLSVILTNIVLEDKIPNIDNIDLKITCKVGG